MNTFFERARGPLTAAAIASTALIGTPLHAQQATVHPTTFVNSETTVRSRLTDAQKEILRREIGAVLEARKPDVILYGEANHCELGFSDWLSDPKTVAMHEALGVKEYDLEMPASDQRSYDRVARASRVPNPSPQLQAALDKLKDILVQGHVESSSCAPDVAAASERLNQRLVSNPDVPKVVASDYATENSTRLHDEVKRLDALKAQGKATEADVNKAWRNYRTSRLQETKLASELVEKVRAQQGPIVVERGSAHYLADSPTGIRANLQDAKSVTFIFAWDRATLEKMRANAAADGYGLRHEDCAVIMGPKDFGVTCTPLKEVRTPGPTLARADGPR